MTAVVPAVEGFLREETRAWVAVEGARVAWLERDAEAYWRFLRGEWLAEDGDLLVVEHDVVPAPGVTGSMAACPRPWCSSPYRIANGWLPDGLGCVRLAGRLKERHPDLMERLGEMTGDGLPPKDWRRLDVRLSQLLKSLGYRPHLHKRSLHLHDYAAVP